MNESCHTHQAIRKQDLELLLLDSRALSTLFRDMLVDLQVVCACVCVCVKERDEKMKGKERER